MGFDQRIAELKLELPPPPKPVGVYTPLVKVGNLAFASGHGPLKVDGTLFEGKVGAPLSIEEGYHAARQVGLAMLATLRKELGTLDKIKRVVKVLGLVNCTAEFREQPKVMNGFSELMVAVFGEAGRAARSAVGTNSLPSNIPVEVEAIFELEA